MKSNNNSTPYLSSEDILKNDFFDDEEQYVEPTTEQIAAAKKLCPDIPPGCLVEILGRQYKNNILNHSQLIEFIASKSEGKDIVFIPLTTEYLLKSYDKKGKLKNLKGASSEEKSKALLSFHSNISRGIDILTRMNVIHEIEINMPNGLNYKPHQQAKKYYVNHYNLDNVLSLLYQLSNKKQQQNPKKLFEMVRLDADLKITQNDYKKVKDIYTELYNWYPQIPYFVSFIAELNKRIDFDVEKIRFSPNIHIRSSDGTITKIGIRAYSDVCRYTSFEKQINKNSNYKKKSDEIYREDYLISRLGNDYEEFDVKASVPRVARAINKNKPMGTMKEDIYETLFGKFTDDYELLFGEKGNLNEPNCRSFFKLMFMRLYFGGDAKRIAKGILKKEKRAEGIEIHKENELAKKEKRVPNFISVVKPFCEYEKKGFSLEELIEKWQKPLVKIIGANDNDKKTEVFLDESCIYLLVNKRLRDMGIDFVQVYDGFYFPKKTLNSVDNPNGIDLEKIINEAKEEYVLLVEKLILEQYNESVDKMIGIYH